MVESVAQIIGRAQGLLSKADEYRKNGRIAEALLCYKQAGHCYLEAAERSNIPDSKKYIEEAKYCSQMVEALKSQVVPKKVSIADTSTVSGEGADEEIVDYEKSQKFRTKQNPTARFKFIAGMKETINELQHLLIKDANDPLIKKWGIGSGGMGILFYGPPGCGKTLIIEAFGNELGVEWFEATGADIVSRWYGEATKNVRLLFNHARWCAETKKKKTIIFLDDFDTIAKRRAVGELHEESQRVVTQFLHELNNLPDNVVVFAASNYPWNLDPAFIRAGRIGKHIFIPPPDFEARREMFKIKFYNKPGGKDLDYDRIAELTDGYSSSDIMARGGICDTVLEKCYTLEKDTGVEVLLTMDMIQTVIRSIVPKIFSYVKEIEILLKDSNIAPFIIAQYPPLVEMVKKYQTLWKYTRQS